MVCDDDDGVGGSADAGVAVKCFFVFYLFFVLLFKGFTVNGDSGQAGSVGGRARSLCCVVDRAVRQWEALP